MGTKLIVVVLVPVMAVYAWAVVIELLPWVLKALGFVAFVWVLDRITRGPRV